MLTFIAEMIKKRMVLSEQLEQLIKMTKCSMRKKGKKLSSFACPLHLNFGVITFIIMAMVTTRYSKYKLPR